MKGRPTILTPEQRQWLADNFADTRNEDCARHLNVGWRTVVRLARTMGLEKSPAFMEQSWRKGVETMRIMNKGEGNAGAKNLLKYGIPYRFKKGETSRQRLGDEREDERLRKAHESRNKTIKSERVRINWGLPQKTKMRLVSNRKHCVMRYALKKRGYIVARGAIDVYYNNDTRRSPIVERHAHEIGIRIFKQ